MLTHRSIHHSTWPMWHSQLQHTLMQVHTVAHWWGPGLLTVVGIPIAGWIVRYLLYEFPSFCPEAWVQFVRGIAFFALPISYLLWFALPYVPIELGLMTAVVITLVYLTVRILAKRHGQVSGRFQRQAPLAVEGSTKHPNLFGVIRGGRAKRLYRVELPFTGVLTVNLWAETKGAALERTVELVNEQGFGGEDPMVTQWVREIQYHEHVFDGDTYLGKRKDVRVSEEVKKATDP